MTPTPDPAERPASPTDLSGLVDELEEKAASDVAAESGSVVDAEDDTTEDVPGAPEPPD